MKKRIDYRHFVCIAITIGFVLMGAFLYRNSYLRLWESLRDFGLSFAYYFCVIFGLAVKINPMVKDFSKVNLSDVVSIDFVAFKQSFGVFASNFGSWQSIKNYLLFLSKSMTFIVTFSMIAVMLVLAFYILFKSALAKQNNKYNRDSRPLRAFKFLSKYTYTPARNMIVGFVDFLKAHSGYLKLWLFIWLLNLNLLTIVFAVLAYLFYFVVSFDFANITVQIYKLFIDVSLAFSGLPLYVWAVVALFLFFHVRKKIGFRRLQHMELQNRGFINARPIVTMICGSMGTGKTTAATDMALSQEIMFRDKAYALILENDLKFPNFPWINLEKEVRRAMEYHQIYNLATCKIFVRKKLHRWIKNTCREKIFDYDYNRYGVTYDDNLKLNNIWDVIFSYVQLYFIYIIRSSLIVSNFSIRTDNVVSDLGNFPVWDSDFFGRDSRLIDSFSRHSKIIDFDALRLGQKVLNNNKNKDFWEFGVVAITEIGKERGNNLENRELKKNVVEANQRNDLFNSWLKMVRHSATIDNYPFVKVITDEQRPSSWGADARDLCEIVHIRDCSEAFLALPFFAFDELLYSLVFKRFAKIYQEYRYMRGDNTLFMHIFKTVSAALQRHYMRVFNQFSYRKLTTQIESGTMDGNFTEHKYFLMSKKIYSKRFRTDCFSDYFAVKAARSSVGLSDMPEYQTEKATISELAGQKSYFIDDLISIWDSKNP